MLNRPTYYSQAISVLVPAGTGAGARLSFREQPRLENAYVLAVEAFTAAQQTFDDQQRAVVPAAEAPRYVVTLSDKEQTDRVQMTPFVALIAQLFAGVVRPFNRMRVNWPKSYVQCVQAPATTGVVLVFNVHYLPKEEADRLTADQRAALGL